MDANMRREASSLLRIDHMVMFLVSEGIDYLTEDGPRPLRAARAPG